MALDRSKFRKIVESPFSGQEYEIVKISYSLFLQQIGTLPVETSKTLGEQLAAAGEAIKSKTDEDPTFAPRLIQFYLETGIVSPRIFFGEFEDTPDDQINFKELGNDVNWLVETIMKFSGEIGIKKKMGEISSGSGTDNPGHDSEAVREAPVGDSPEGNGPPQP